MMRTVSGSSTPPLGSLSRSSASSPSSPSPTLNANNFSIRIGRKTFPIIGAKSTEIFVIKSGLCRCNIKEDQVLIDNDGTEEIQIIGERLDAELLNVKSKGKVVININITPEDLNLNISCPELVLNCKLKTSGIAVFNRFHAEGVITINYDCIFPLLFLTGATLYLNNAELLASKALVKLDSIETKGVSSFYVIGDMLFAGDRFNLIPAEIARLFQRSSQVEIENLSCKIDFCVYKTSLLVTNLQLPDDAYLWFHQVHAELKSLQSAGKIVAIESDLYVDGMNILDKESDTYLNSSDICSINNQIFGKVHLNHPDFNMPNVPVYESRIISAKPIDDKPFSILSKATSKNFLRMHLEAITESQDKYLRSLKLPADKNSLLNALLISLLFAGLSESKRGRILQIFVDHYKHGARKIGPDNTKLLSPTEADAFFKHYKEMHDIVHILDFMNKYVKDPKLKVIDSFAEYFSKVIRKKDIFKYFAEIGINVIVKHQTNNPGANTTTYIKVINEITITCYSFGHDPEHLYHEPEIDLHDVAEIKLCDPVAPREKIGPQHKMLEIYAIFCYYTKLKPSIFGAEYADQIKAILDKFFKTREHANDPGSTVIHENAAIYGIKGEIYVAESFLCDGIYAVKTPSIIVKNGEIGESGKIEGFEHANLQVQTCFSISGELAADELVIAGDHIVPYLGKISGRKKLNIASLTYVPIAGQLQTANGHVDTFLYLNFGVSKAYNKFIDAMISFDGFTLASEPYSFDDIVNPQKLFTLVKMGVGSIYPPAGTALQFAAHGYSLSVTIYRLYSAWSNLHGKAWEDVTLYDLSTTLKLLKSGIIESVGFYRAAPSMTQWTMIANYPWHDLTITWSAPMSAMQNANDLLNNAYAELQDLDRSWGIFSQDTLKQNPAIKDVLDPCVNLLSLFGPSYHVNSGLSLGGAVQFSGSITSQNLISFQAGRQFCFSYANQSVFYQRNFRTYSALAYDWHTTSLFYSNAGSTTAINWQITATNWYEHGNTNALVRIFDVRNGYIAPNAKFLGKGKITGTVHDRLLVAGKADFVDGYVAARNEIIFIKSADVTSDVAFFKGQRIIRDGEWQYVNALGFEVDHFDDIPGSSIMGEDGSVIILKANTANIDGNGSHYVGYFDIKKMSATQMRDLVIGLGQFAGRVDFRHAVYGSTDDATPIEFAGHRSNGAEAALRTGGPVTLPANYTRAQGDQFASYAEASAIAANYQYYKVPPPPPPKKKKGLKKIGREIVRIIDNVKELVGAGAGVAQLAKLTMVNGAGLIAGAIALAADQITRHEKLKESKYRESVAIGLVENEHKINLAKLENEQQFELLKLTAEFHFAAVQRQAPGRSLTHAKEPMSLADRQQEIRTAYANVKGQLEHANQKLLKDIHAVYKAEQLAIMTAEGPKIGAGVQGNVGPTGATISVTATAGPNSHTTATSSIPIASIDSDRAADRSDSAEKSSEQLESRTPGHETDRTSPNRVPLPSADHSDVFTPATVDHKDGSTIFTAPSRTLPLMDRDRQRTETSSNNLVNRLDAMAKRRSLKTSLPPAPTPRRLTAPVVSTPLKVVKGDRKFTEFKAPPRQIPPPPSSRQLRHNTFIAPESRQIPRIADEVARLQQAKSQHAMQIAVLDIVKERMKTKDDYLSHRFASPAHKAAYEQAQKRYAKLVEQYAKDSEIYFTELAKANNAARLARSELHATLGAREQDRAVVLQDLITTMRSYVIQDIDEQTNIKLDALSRISARLEKLERIQRGADSTMKDHCASAGILFASELRHSRAKVNGFVTRHDTVVTAATTALVIASLPVTTVPGAIAGAAGYALMSTKPVHNSMLYALDLALSKACIDEYSRQEMAGFLAEGGKLLVAGAATAAGNYTARATNVFLQTHSFQSPIITQYEASTLYSNPFGALRVRFPFKHVPEKRHLEYLEHIAKLAPGKENIEISTGGYNGFANFAKAREMAIIRANLGEDVVPYLSRVGPHQGNVYVGMSTSDRRCLWRLDLNTRVPPGTPPIPHINWQFYDHHTETIYYGAINIDMTLHEYSQVLNKFPRNLPFIGPTPFR